MNTYTPNQGLTPAGQQLAQGQPNQANTVPPPNAPSSSYGSWDSLNSQFAGANANNVTANAPATRQALVSNSDIPAEQNNYEQLAKQLFEYDQGTLAPQFQGQNPGTPSDAASFGRVEASPLGMTVGSAGLPASSGTYNSNPKYAYSSQMDMGNSIASLLGVLNSAIRDSMTDVKGKNASNVSTAQAALDGIYKLMSLKQDAEDKAAARASSGGLAGQKLNDAKERLLSDAKKGVTFTDLVLRYTPDGLSPSEIRDMYNQVNYYGKPATESEEDVTGLINGTKPGPQAVKAKAVQVEKDKQNTITSVLSLKDSWNHIPEVEKITGLGDNYASYNSQRQIISDQLAKTFGISRSNPAIERLLKAMPSAGIGSTFSQGKFQGALSGLLVSQGYTLVKDKKSGDIGMIQKSEFDKNKYEEVK